MKITKMILLGAAVLITGSAMAQKSDKKVNFSIGPEVGFAVGNFNKTHSVGFGATFQADIDIAPSTKLTLTTGYLSYAGKSAGSGIKYKATGILPLRVGIKYYLTEGFYGAAQLGAGFFNNSGGTALAYTPMLGYEFNTKTEKAVDLALKYDGYSKNGTGLGAVNVRLAYRF